MSVSFPTRPRRAGALAAGLSTCLALTALLSGCASVSDTISPAFADPAKYDLWECKQLETERKSLATRTLELQKLMDKAETGVGGTVVAEMAYRNDYVATRGQLHFADEAWRRNRCRETAPEAPAPPPAPGTSSRLAPGAAAKPAPASKSGSAVY
jgi:uncharacterized protein YceK